MNRSLIFILLGLWVLLLGVLSLNGWYADFSTLPPRLAFALLPPLPVALFFAFSKGGTAFLQRVPAQWLIYLQVFRIGVEIVLWLQVRRGMLPMAMSFEGRNFDILTGLLALPVGYYCYVKKSWPSRVVLLYNIGGLLLLINVVIIAVRSHNTLIPSFPFIYLPGLLVPMAYTLHIFSLRRTSV